MERRGEKQEQKQKNGSEMIGNQRIGGFLSASPAQRLCVKIKDHKLEVKK